MHSNHRHVQLTNKNGVQAVAFPLSAFTTETAARLTDLSVRQLHYWDKTGFFSPAFTDPNTRRPHSRVYSFQDLVGLRAISNLRDAGVSLQELRRVREVFGHDASEDWAKRAFYVVDSRVFFTHEDAIVASRPLGQQAEPRVLFVEPIVADVKDAIRQLQVRSGDQIGKITHSRWIMGGVPILAGTRIPTATIAWFHRHGYSAQEILAEFPRLTEEDINAALASENTQLAAS